MKTQVKWIIGATLALAILFCASFVFFFGRAQQKSIAAAKGNKVHFYGVISYGDKASSLRAAEQKFPFKTFFDENFQLAGALGITRVPVKLYVEDGVMKKVWGGATNDEQKKTAFVQWLDALP